MYAAEHARTNPDKPAIIMAGSGEVITYADYEARANQAAQLLRGLGLKPLDHIALVMYNTPTYITCKGAAERAGLRYVCVNSHLKVDEIAYIINDSESRVAFIGSELLEIARELPAACPNVERWIISEAGDLEAPFESFEELIAPYPKEPIEDERLGVALLYSSGTTGRPKGIARPLPEGHPRDTLPVYAFTDMIFRLTADMTYLSSAPLYHSAPHSALSGAIRLGVTSVVMERFDPEQFLALVEKYKITTTQVVPTMLARIMRLPEEVLSSYDVSTLKTVVHGAAPCPPQLKQAIIDRWGPVMYEYYGATEGHGFTMSDSEEWLARPGTVGKAVLGELVIRDEDGNDCPPGKEGVIWFRGATNFYYKGDPERTAEATDEDGAMATVEDVGYLDEDGYLYLTDRKTHMIISGGVNIYPQEVEDLILSHPEILDAAVIGVPDDDLGEQVKAVVIRTASDKSDADLERELIDYCIERAARFKCPRTVEFVAELPRTPAGKLQKKALRATYWPAK
ncbi:fatty-acyl-CoA synthase/long-chain acyl-CoA synthetase [Antricoccus suffuscus]|uniref:Fatty-acyl-CoA synthase/long-chain acyl-CoA synthetase n=1 Tax=Antricoccus suffuscus TaxID=1629062 RepID=A0A2T1A3B0_9ACTN|nr:AMP-binding protein [Antricoccus suffuscus]PRZ42808.1 fatty-acyl-CoA synthase/long-chain acyl-CoA synthetase [Antricoccus suffuscus]